MKKVDGEAKNNCDICREPISTHKKNDVREDG